MTSSGVSKIVNAMTLTKGSEPGNAAEKSRDFDLMLNRKTAADGELLQQPDSAAKGPVFQRTDALMPLGNAEQTKQTFELEKSGAAWERIQKPTHGGETKVLTDETKQAYGEWKDKVKKVLSEKLGVSEEELEAAMETLGITFENLLMGEGIQELGMELLGVADITDLLFQGNFQELMQEMNLLCSQLMEQANLSLEELQMLAQELEVMETAEGGDAVDELGGITENIPKSEASLNTSGEVPKEIAEEKAKLNQIPVQEAQQNGETDREPLEAVELQETVETGEQSKQEENEFFQDGQKGLSSQWKGSGAEELRPEPGHESQQLSFQTTVQNTVVGNGETMIQTVQRTYVDVQDILHQVSEFTRVTVTNEFSRVEMQLNPEHLGKLYMQLSSREGVITAQLIAQNEAVKQALESQVNVLKENMNNQGMKVEAVEVTIASHEFEEQFQGEQQTGRQQEESKGQRRFLNIDQLDELAGQLSEEESLAAKIMVENGNSMDMTA